MQNLMTRIRPQKFSELIGCDINKKSFLNHIKKVDGATYLLSGERGTGKSSFSWLMANKICKKYDSPKEAVQEINISDKTGVDYAREIIEECNRGSFFSCSVYILNEFHEATKNFQDAILDIFENQPKNTFFILCTTKPDKLDKAVLSRCTRYVFEELNKENYLKFIENVKKEIDVNEELLDLIFEASCGIPREILSIIEGISPLKKEEAIEFIKNYRIDLSEDSTIKELNQELMKLSSIDKALSLMDSIKAKPEDIRNSILGYFTRVLIKPFGSSKQKEESRLHASVVIECFKENVFYSGKAGLALAIYNCYN